VSLRSCRWLGDDRVGFPVSSDMRVLEEVASRQIARAAREQLGERVDHVLADDARSTLGARRSRMNTSTIDNHFNWLPIVVLSKTKSQHHASFGASALRRWHPLTLDPRRRFFASLQAVSAPLAATDETLETTQHAILILGAASRCGDIHTVASPSPTAASASQATPRPWGAWP
jgi:hypothetical protein